MRTEIHCLIDRYGNVGIGSLCNVIEAISATCTAGEIRKLIDITTRLETEVLEEFEICLLTQHGYGELPGPFDHIMCIVCLIHADAQLIWLRCRLNRRVDNAAVILLTVTCGQHKQTIT